jgi:DNA-directed RNA polymerase
MIDPYDLMRQNGVSLKESAIAARVGGKMSTTASGARMIREGGGLMLKALKRWVAKAKEPRRGPADNYGKRVLQLLDEVSLERAAALTLQILVDKTTTSSDSDCTTVNLRRTLGLALELEASWRRYKKVSPIGHAYGIKDFSRSRGVTRAKKHRSMLEVLVESGDSLDWDGADRAMLAARLIDLAVKSTGLFSASVRSTGKRKRNVVVLHPSVMAWVAKGEETLGLLPRYLPVTEKPLDWGPGLQGGFDPDRVPPLPFMSGRSSLQRKALANSDCPDVYSAVNALQGTRWRVNKHTDNLMRHAVDNGWSDCGVPADPGEAPQPPKTPFDKKAPEWVEHLRRKRAWGLAYSDFRTAAGNVGRALSMSKEFSELPHFHMVHTVDFRGRCYPVGGSLGYQGADFQRSLTEFADPLPMGEGLDWFLITGANLFGEDKCSHEDRKAWVAANSEELIACGQDPTRNRIWLEADKPFQFAAWAKEFAEMQHDGDAYKSRIPVGLDGSNNGLQVYSLLLRDEVGGVSTNCTPSESPADIYQVVADRATELIRQELKHSKDATQRRWCKQILDFCDKQGLGGLPRKAAKRPTMVLPYGGTMYSTQSYLAEWYHDYVRGKNIPDAEHPFPQRDAFQALTYLGTLLWQALGDVVVKAREAMEWLHQVSDLVSDQNAHVGWTTPLGLRCKQSYLKGKTKTVNFYSGGRLSLEVWEATNVVDSRKSRNGLAPNYIHSLDAAVMMHTTNLMNAQGVGNLRMIHDDYAAHAAHAVTLYKTLRYAFVDIFRHDLLAALHTELKTQFPETDIPYPPDEGNLELDKLLTSKYFFT